MNEITLQSRLIAIEMREIDSKTPIRLLEHYERCPDDRRLEYVAALAAALCVSEKRRRADA